jgi:hypothetical protein
MDTFFHIIFLKRMSINVLFLKRAAKVMTKPLFQEFFIKKYSLLEKEMNRSLGFSSDTKLIFFFSCSCICHGASCPVN